MLVIFIAYDDKLQIFNVWQKIAQKLRETFVLLNILIHKYINSAILNYPLCFDSHLVLHQ